MFTVCLFFVVVLRLRKFRYPAKKKILVGVSVLDPLIRTSKNKKAAHAGPLGQLKAIEEPLLCHIFELREQGITVSTFKLVMKASQLCTSFGAKHIVAQFSAVNCF